MLCPAAWPVNLWWRLAPLRVGHWPDHPTLQGSEQSYLERLEQLQAVLSGYLEKNMLGNQMLPARVLELEEEVRNLRKINRDLFDFSTRIITRPSK